MIAYLRLIRVGMLLSPAADVVAGLALTGTPWTLAAGRAAVASACVYAAGMALNDHADRAVDAVERPERPIPSGKIPASVALLLGLGLMAGAILISPGPLFHAALCALVLAYDYGCKRIVWLGAAFMATLRGLNLTTAHFLFGATDLPPVLLYAALAYGLYIFAVTILGWLEDVPNAKPKAVLALVLVPPLVALLALLQTEQAVFAAGPAGVLALGFWLRVARRRTWDRGAIRGAMTWLLIGTMLYTALLCAGSGRFVEAGGVLLAAVIGRRISRSIAVT